MGLERNIYIEPFIRIPIQYSKNDEQRWSCGEHEDNSGNRFCPICGREIKAITVPAFYALWPEDLIGNDNLWHYTEGETMFLLSNTYGGTKICTDENKITAITPELINECIEEFIEKHKEEISILEKRFGRPMLVEFGFLYLVR